MPYGNCNKGTYHGELARGNEVANGEAEGHVSLNATIWASEKSKDSHSQVLTAELKRAR